MPEQKPSEASSTETCERCSGKGTVTYDIPGDGASAMGGFGTRPCVCVKDLPAVHGKATWWDWETLYSTGVPVLMPASEAIGITAGCEVPRRDDGRRVHRIARNVWYPALIDMYVGKEKVMLDSERARKLGAALIEAADACDKADEMSQQHTNTEGEQA